MDHILWFLFRQVDHLWTLKTSLEFISLGFYASNQLIGNNSCHLCSRIWVQLLYHQSQPLFWNLQGIAKNLGRDSSGSIQKSLAKI